MPFICRCINYDALIEVYKINHLSSIILNNYNIVIELSSFLEKLWEKLIYKDLYYNFNTYLYYLFSSVPVILVGNKIDLHQERTVSVDEGKKLAESWKAAIFIETSAKNNESVAEIFHKLLAQIERENGNPPPKSNCFISWVNPIYIQ